MSLSSSVRYLKRLLCARTNRRSKGRKTDCTRKGSEAPGGYSALIFYEQKANKKKKKKEESEIRARFTTILACHTLSAQYCNIVDCALTHTLYNFGWQNALAHIEQHRKGQAVVVCLFLGHNERARQQTMPLGTRDSQWRGTHWEQTNLVAHGQR